jgi:hypothetical protein
MEKNVEEAMLATLQDILIFQMASKGVPQSQNSRSGWRR